MSLRERESTRRLGIIEPRLPSPAKAPPSGPGWLHEIKHDGFRILARRDSAGVRLITRNGNDFTSRFPFIEMAVKSLPVRSCLIWPGGFCTDTRSPDRRQRRALRIRSARARRQGSAGPADRNPKDCACQGAQGLAPEHRPQRAFRGGRRGRLPGSVSAWLRGCRVKAAWLALSFWPVPELGEGQKPKCSGSEARSRRRLGFATLDKVQKPESSDVKRPRPFSLGSY